jgi:hypothetical protein
MYKVKIGDEKMTYAVASPLQEVKRGRNQLVDRMELPIQKGDVFNGNVVSIDLSSMTIEFFKNNKREQLTVSTQSVHDLKAHDAINVHVLSSTKESLKLSITKSTSEKSRSAQNHNPITQTVNVAEFKKTLIESNSPLQYSKQLEQHIEQTMTQVDTLLKSFSDEELSTLIQENYDVAKMSLDVLYQLGHSPRIDKKIALVGDKKLTLDITIDDESVKKLIEENVKSSGLLAIPEEQLKHIIGELIHKNLQPSLKNVEKVYNFTQKVDKIKEIDMHKIIQFLASNKESTVGEVYKSLFVSKSKEKHTIMTDEEYKSIKADVQSIMDEQFPDVENKEDLYLIAKTIVVKGLPLNERALDIIGFVKSKTENEESVRIAVEQLQKNNKPEDWKISEKADTNKILLKEDVQKIVSVIRQATTTMIEELAVEQKPITIQSLASKMPQLGLFMEDKSIKEQQDRVKAHGLARNESVQVPLSRDIENLEILRYQMTFKAAMRLNIEGVDLANSQLELLRNKIENLSTEFARMNTVDNPTIEAPLLIEEPLILEVNRYFSRIHGASTASIAGIAIDSTTEETLSSIVQKVERGIDRYDQLRTMPRPDLGDTIEKAFSNVDAILEDLSLENTRFNQRAVEILGRNEMSISQENINKVKVLDLQLQELMERLVPEHVKELVENKVDILNEPIEALLKFTMDKEGEILSNRQEQVAKSLYHLFQKEDLTNEQKNNLIGVYRMISTIEQSKGAAIGFLIERHLPMTLENLFDASNYIRSSGENSLINATVDDAFGQLHYLQKEGLTIKEQILSGYFETEKALDTTLQEILQGEFQRTENNGAPLSNELLKEIYTTRVNSEVTQLREVLQELNPKQKSMIKEGLIIGKELNQSLNINDWKALSLMDKDTFALKPVLSELYNQLKSVEHLKDAFESSIAELMENPTKEGKLKFEESLLKIMDEAKGESMRQAFEENNTLSSRSTNNFLDASASKPFSNLAQDLESQLLLQRTMMKEDYHHIPIIVNGQLQQMNMFFLGRESTGTSQEESMSIYFSFSTQNIGTANVRIQLLGDDIDVTMFSTSPRGNQKVKDFEQRFITLFDTIGFHVNKIKFDSFKVPKPVGQETVEAQTKKVRKYKESRYETMI